MSDKKQSGPFSSEAELDSWRRLLGLFRTTPVEDHNLLSNLALYIPRQSVMRLLFFHELYQRIISIPGTIIELGCKWGANLAWFTNLRGIYEPYNHNRRIVGFDTFDGLRGNCEKDGQSPWVVDGKYSTSPGYESHLNAVLQCQESFSPIAHIRKFEIVSGDVRQTLPMYLEQNSQTIIALAYFDMDLYEPTKMALQAILPYITKGSIIGFDELNWSEMPGPTRALQEVLGLRRYQLFHSTMQPIPGYLIIE